MEQLRQKVVKMEEERKEFELVKEEMETMRKALDKRNKLCEILGVQAKKMTLEKDEVINTLKQKLEEGAESAVSQNTIDQLTQQKQDTEDKLNRL